MKDYGSGRGLAGVDLVVPPGQCCCVLGPNGAGKSTLFNALIGHVRPTSGQVLVCGFDPTRHAGQVRARTGIVPQDDVFDAALTVRDNLRLFARFYALNARQAATATDRVLERFGLSEYAGVRVRELSGGYRRRLSLARALLHDPALIIMDEPSTGLDPVARRELWDAIRDLHGSGTTIVLSTHYMEEAAHLADRIVGLRRGRIVMDLPSAAAATMLGTHVIDVPSGGCIPAAVPAGHVASARGRDFLFFTSESAALSAVGVLQLDDGAAAVRSTTLDDVYEFVLSGHSHDR